MQIHKENLECKECGQKCISHIERNPDEFYKNLKKINDERIKQIAGTFLTEANPSLAQILNEDKHKELIIVTTGSDGREENLPCTSSIEIILYCPEKLNSAIKKLIEQILGSSLIKFQKNTLHFISSENPHSLIEINEYKKPQNIFFYTLKNKVFFPTRFLDSKLLYGLGNKYENLRKIFINDIQNNSLIQKKIKEFRTSKLNSHKKISETGIQKFKGKKLIHFDKENGIIYFEKTSELERGIKMGPIRYYQYKIAILIFKLIKENRFNDDELKSLIYISKDIKSKIELIRDKIKGLPQAEGPLKDFINIYYRFLYLHLLSQKIYKKEFKPIEFQLNPNEAKEFKEQLNFTNEILKNLST